MRASFFFNDTAATEIYTLSLHDALPIWIPRSPIGSARTCPSCARPTHGRSSRRRSLGTGSASSARARRSEEHTSELQSPCNLVCRLLLEKKKALLQELIRMSSLTLLRAC